MVFQDPMSSLDPVYRIGNQIVEQIRVHDQNVSKAEAMVAQELRTMQQKPAAGDELDRVKAMVLRQIPLGEDSVDEIARGFLDRRDLDLPLDEPTVAARRYVALSAQEIQAAFAKWMRPGDIVRITQGPPPQ